MCELGDAPQGVEPLARSGLGRDQQARAKRPGGVAELAARAVEPAAKRPRQALGQVVEPLLLRGEQGLAGGPMAQQRLQLLAAALRGAACAALGAGAER